METIERIVFGNMKDKFYFHRFSSRGDEIICHSNHQNVVDSAEQILQGAETLIYERIFELPFPKEFEIFYEEMLNLLSNKNYKRAIEALPPISSQV